MRRRALLIVTATALAACRALIGIEEQSVPGDDAVDGGTRDGALPDGTISSEAAVEASTKPAPTPACASKVGGECLKCCRDLTPPGNMPLDQALAAGCLCGGEALCQTPCATALCAGAAPGSPGSACLTCVTQNTTNAACSDAFTTCRTNATCAPIADCIQGTCQ